MNITDLRKYRIQLDPYKPGFIFNQNGIGIALFDLISSFIGAYILDKLFNLSKFFKSEKTYYLLVIPAGVLAHLLFKQKTYLNEQLFNYNMIYVFLMIFIFVNLM